MASSTQHGTIGRHTTTSTDAAASNRCIYTDDQEKRWPAVISKVTDSNGVIVDLFVLSNPTVGSPAQIRIGVQHSIDHKNTNTWDFT